MASVTQPPRTNAGASSSGTLDQPPVRRTLFPQVGSTRRTTAPTANPLDLGAFEKSQSGILARDQDGRVITDSLLEVVLPDIPQEKDEDAERAQLNNKLIELYRTHNNRQQVDDEELRAAIQKSLRDKVASLDDDKWMFEVEDEAEVHMT